LIPEEQKAIDRNKELIDAPARTCLRMNYGTVSYYHVQSSFEISITRKVQSFEEREEREMER